MEPRYEMPFRPTYEATAMASWAVATVTTGMLALTANVPITPFAFMGGISLAMVAMRGWQTWRHVQLKINLMGQGLEFYTIADLQKKMKKKTTSLWLGKGFVWTGQHTQRMIELEKRNVTDLTPPRWLLKLLRINVAEQDMPGRGYIHGVSETEDDIYIPMKLLEGHLLILGSTGTGKTRLYETTISQAILRNEAVFVFDPKGDEDLADTCRRACQIAGRPEAFQYFHPSHPKKSIRIDPLRNWTRVTEVASRIAQIMPGAQQGGSSDPFAAFAWEACNAVVSAQVYCEENPSIAKLLRFIGSGPDQLTERCLRRFFQQHAPDWETHVAAFVNQARQNKLNNSRVKFLPPEVAGVIHYYETAIPEDIRDPVVDGIIKMTVHNREHFQKMINSIIPVLTMLTAGEMRGLLSPDANDINDSRPIFDIRKLIASRCVTYIALDTMPDQAVGQAIGSMFMADLTSSAGERYNSGEFKDGNVIQVIVDEAAEVGNMVQLANKSRGAGMRLSVASQNFSDFVDRYGDEHKARMALGNFNNILALRLPDPVTQLYFAERIPKTSVATISKTYGAGGKTEDGGMEFSGNVGEQLRYERMELFDPAWLGQLPTMHYVAYITGGDLYKGRLPILEHKMRVTIKQ